MYSMTKPASKSSHPSGMNPNRAQRMQPSTEDLNALGNPHLFRYFCLLLVPSCLLKAGDQLVQIADLPLWDVSLQPKPQLNLMLFLFSTMPLRSIHVLRAFLSGKCFFHTCALVFNPIQSREIRLGGIPWRIELLLWGERSTEGSSCSD